MYIFSSVRKFSVTSYWFWTVTGACRHDHICSVMFWRITAVARLKHGRRTADAHVPSNMSLFSLRLGPARVDETRVYKLILLCFACRLWTVLCFSSLHHQVTWAATTSVVWALHNVHNLFIMSIIQELFQKLWTLHNLLCKTIIYYVKP